MREKVFRHVSAGGRGERTSLSGGLPLSGIWSAAYNHCFYLTPDKELMAAEVKLNGGMPEVGEVRWLFEVTAYGKRFLVNTAVEQKASSPITLVVNWTADLKRYFGVQPLGCSNEASKLKLELRTACLEFDL